jgi:hypothetical protein
MNERIALTACIRPGRRASLERCIDAGPPFDLAAAGFERHDVYLGPDEVVFVFEGTQPLERLRALSVERMRDLLDLGSSVTMPRIQRPALTWQPPYPRRFSWQRGHRGSVAP